MLREQSAKKCAWQDEIKWNHTHTVDRWVFIMKFLLLITWIDSRLNTYCIYGINVSSVSCLYLNILFTKHVTTGQTQQIVTKFQNIKYFCDLFCFNSVIYFVFCFKFFFLQLFCLNLWSFVSHAHKLLPRNCNNRVYTF